MDWTFTLIQRNSTTYGSEGQEMNIYTAIHLPGLDTLHIRHSPHQTHTRTEHATQGKVMTYVTCTQYTMVSTELQHCACLCDVIWSRIGEKEERELFTNYYATGFESVIATVYTIELSLVHSAGAVGQKIAATTHENTTDEWHMDVNTHTLL